SGFAPRNGGCGPAPQSGAITRATKRNASATGAIVKVSHKAGWPSKVKFLTSWMYGPKDPRRTEARACSRVGATELSVLMLKDGCSCALKPNQAKLPGIPSEVQSAGTSTAKQS